MKILQIHNTYGQPGGEDTLVAAEAAALIAAGHEVVPFTASNPAVSARSLPQFAQAPWNPGAARHLARALAADRPDVAHVHNTWFSLSPSVFESLRRAGVPTVMTLHNYRLVCANSLFYRDGAVCTACLGTHPWRGLQHRCFRGSVVGSAVAASTIALNRARDTWGRSVDRFVVTTRFAADTVVQGGVPADRIRIVPPVLPIDTSPVTPSASRTVLCVGRVEAEKGVDTLVAAWRQAAPPGLELVLVGDGPLRAEIDAAAIPGVRTVGWRDHSEVLAMMRSARALVFPSPLFETLGMSVLEAMATGIPVVAADVGVRREVVGQDGAGLLCPPGDVDAMAQRLAALGDDALVDAAGAQARARYDDTYAPEIGLRLLQDVYRELSR